MKTKIILIVCRGNIARSPVAAILLNRVLQEKHLDKEYLAISRGVQGTAVDPTPVKFSNIVYYENLYKEMSLVLKELDIDLSRHISQSINETIATKAIIIFAMDKQIKKDLSVLFPDKKDKIHLFSEITGMQLDITDPEGVSGIEEHKQIFGQINTMIHEGFPALIQLIHTSNSNLK